MIIIISDITSLSQHNQRLEERPEDYRPKCCPHCACHICWAHGSYYRKPSRDKRYDDADNPIRIPRFLCKDCGGTFSCLPECIPPRRWYSWNVQEVSFKLLLKTQNFLQAARELIPSRTTLSRWLNHWKKDHAVYADYLKNSFPDLGRLTDFRSFWDKCLSKFSLAKVMRFLFAEGAPVPCSLE